MCKEVKLNNEDFEVMTVGACLDYIDEYVDRKNPNKKRTRKAGQDDFDKF